MASLTDYMKGTRSSVAQIHKASADRGATPILPGQSAPSRPVESVQLTRRSGKSRGPEYEPPFTASALRDKVKGLPVGAVVTGQDLNAKRLIVPIVENGGIRHLPAGELIDRIYFFDQDDDAPPANHDKGKDKKGVRDKDSSAGEVVFKPAAVKRYKISV